MTARRLSVVLVLVFVAIVVAATIIQNRKQVQLISNGFCKVVTEALYTPPPVAHSTCTGGINTTQHCQTYYTQSDPYMRTLWRCADPKRGDKVSEFWRRSE